MRTGCHESRGAAEHHRKDDTHPNDNVGFNIEKNERTYSYDANYFGSQFIFHSVEINSFFKCRESPSYLVIGPEVRRDVFIESREALFENSFTYSNALLKHMAIIMCVFIEIREPYVERLSLNAL